jgi:preprotein translocase subunit SecG
MQIILLVVQIILAVLLVGIILIQRSNSDGLSGLGGGSNNGLISSKSSASFLTKTTAILATFFMINSLVLANLASKTNNDHSVIDQYINNKDNSLDSKKVHDHNKKHQGPSAPVAN